MNFAPRFQRATFADHFGALFRFSFFRTSWPKHHFYLEGLRFNGVKDPITFFENIVFSTVLVRKT